MRRVIIRSILEFWRWQTQNKHDSDGGKVECDGKAIECTRDFIDASLVLSHAHTYCDFKDSIRLNADSFDSAACNFPWAEASITEPNVEH